MFRALPSFPTNKFALKIWGCRPVTVEESKMTQVVVVVDVDGDGDGDGEEEIERNTNKKRKIEAVQTDIINKQTLDSSTSDTQAEVCGLGINFEMLFSNWEASDFPPSRLRNSRFKQELIAIMALGDERTIDFSPDGTQSSNSDINLQDEVRRLMKEMEITIQEVQESKFYHNFVEQLQNDSTIQSNMRRVLGHSSYVQMVIYAIGSIEYSYVSQYQLALAILLKRDFSHWIGGVEVFDPQMSPADCKVMELFGCIVLTINEQCKRQVDEPMLFYLPYLQRDRVGNLLEANWCPARLNKMIILSNSFESITESCRETTTKTVSDGMIHYDAERERVEYIEAIQKHTTEIKIDKLNGICYGFSWHFFNLDFDLDLDSLLPGDPPKNIRLKLRRLNDKLNNCRSDYRLLENLEEQYSKDPFYNTDPGVYDWFEMNFLFRNTRRMHCLWRQPHTGWIKLNFSGKARGESTSAGFGGIFRDEHKKCLAKYSGNLGGEADSVTANAEALRQGLRCVRFMSPPVRKLVAEGDELRIIRWVNGGPEPPTRIAEALAEIRELLVGIEAVVRHVYEEANSLAVELAKRGTSLPNLRVWISPPS